MLRLRYYLHFVSFKSRMPSLAACWLFLYSMQNNAAFLLFLLFPFKNKLLKFNCQVMFWQEFWQPLRQSKIETTLRTFQIYRTKVMSLLYTDIYYTNTYPCSILRFSLSSTTLFSTSIWTPFRFCYVLLYVVFYN